MKKAYIGRSGSGKSTKLLQELKEALENNIIHESSTLLFILDSEEEAYKNILPHATYCINKKECPVGRFDTMIVDTIYMDQEKLQNLDITSDKELPKNVFWTFQDVSEISQLFPILDTESKIKLAEMNEEISKMPDCVVVEIEK